MRSRLSTKVEMRMVIAGTEYPLSQLAPDFALLAEDVQVPIGRAQVVTIVDGEESNNRLVSITGQDGRRVTFVASLA